MKETSCEQFRSRNVHSGYLPGFGTNAKSRSESFQKAPPCANELPEVPTCVLVSLLRKSQLHKTASSDLKWNTHSFALGLFWSSGIWSSLDLFRAKSSIFTLFSRNRNCAYPAAVAEDSIPISSVCPSAAFFFLLFFLVCPPTGLNEKALWSNHERCRWSQVLCSLKNMTEETLVCLNKAGKKGCSLYMPPSSRHALLHRHVFCSLLYPHDQRSSSTFHAFFVLFLFFLLINLTPAL